MFGKVGHHLAHIGLVQIPQKLVLKWKMCETVKSHPPEDHLITCRTWKRYFWTLLIGLEWVFLDTPAWQEKLPELDGAIICWDKRNNSIWYDRINTSGRLTCPGITLYTRECLPSCVWKKGESRQLASSSTFSSRSSGQFLIWRCAHTALRSANSVFNFS